jgi:ABC-type multidrug transport system fused ATPase/permease subunit
MVTAAKIQDIFRQEMQQSTVITIAHRAEAVQNASSCIALTDGRLAEHRLTTTAGA